jgi:hypothetical protein
MPLLQVTKHQAMTRTTVISHQISVSKSFSTTDITMELNTWLSECQQTAKVHIAPSETKQQKNAAARDRILSDPAISRHDSSGEVHRWSLLKHETSAMSMKTCVKKIFVLA